MIRSKSNPILSEVRRDLGDEGVVIAAKVELGLIDAGEWHEASVSEVTDALKVLNRIVAVWG
jgi:hypothetical protein